MKRGLDSDVYVGNTLIHFYGSCGKIEDAHKVFDEMTIRTVVSWNSIVSACVENSKFRDSVELFFRMRDCGFEPDEATMVILLSGCAEVGNLSLGKWVHCQVIEKGLTVNCELGTSLVDMYYAEVGMWEKVEHVRSGMRDRGLKKMAGVSSVQVGSSIHRFFSGDDSQIAYNDIYLLLDRLNLHMKMVNFESSI